METKGQSKEQGTWIDRDTCLMVVDEVKELKNPQSGLVVGTSTQKVEIKATIDDLMGGINLKQDYIAKNKAAIEKHKATIDSLGKVPAKTSEMVRLEQNLIALEKIKQKSHAETQILEAENAIAKDEAFVEERMKIINARPEA